MDWGGFYSHVDLLVGTSLPPPLPHKHQLTPFNNPMTSMQLLSSGSRGSEKLSNLPRVHGRARLPNQAHLMLDPRPSPHCSISSSLLHWFRLVPGESGCGCSGLGRA